MILPFAKLGALALKTVSKPLAATIRFRASRHPKFRELIINFAQVYHRLNVNLQRRLYGHDTSVDIRPLNEEKAVTTAADLLGELVVFGVGGGIIIFEVSRSAISESRKEEARRLEREALRSKDAELEKRIEELENRLNELDPPNQRYGLSSWLPGIGPSGSKKGEKSEKVEKTGTEREKTEASVPVNTMDTPPSAPNADSINLKTQPERQREMDVVTPQPTIITDNGNEKIFAEPKKKSGKYYLFDRFTDSGDKFSANKDL